jgi:glycosyltransferase involved in cell wall biosynthesis
MNFKNLESPLISIIVVSYNSSEYIIETLQSAEKQTYNKIELIITDDCSSDDTINICQNWLAEKRNRFVRTELISAKHNSGIPANCNRGILASRGEWVKFIAGDDTLLENCICDFLEFIGNNPNKIHAVHSNMNVFSNNFLPESFKLLADYSNSDFNKPDITPNEQYFSLLRQTNIGAPTFFVKKSLLCDLGGYDEEMPYEDWPMFLSILKRGFKIYHLNKSTVNYRLHDFSVYNNNVSGNLIFNDFFLKDRVVYIKYRKDQLTYIERFIEDLEYHRKRLFLRTGLNKSSKVNRYLNDLFLFIYRFFKRVSFFIAKRIS